MEKLANKVSPLSNLVAPLKGKEKLEESRSWTIGWKKILNIHEMLLLDEKKIWRTMLYMLCQYCKAFCTFQNIVNYSKDCSLAAINGEI
jgi:hypothetical protein